MGKKWWFLVGASAVIMAFWIVGISSVDKAKVQERETEATESMEFPCILGDCGLVAELLVNYEGTFREDGSNRNVEGVAGLVVYNPGMEGVQTAELVVYQQDRTLDFSVTYLPADSRCLVLEASGQLYSGEPVTDCGYKSVTWGDFSGQTAEIAVGSGDSQIWVENRTDKTLDSVTVYYKIYMSRERFYLGGITYCVTLENLQPWEKREVMSVISGQIVAIE